MALSNLVDLYGSRETADTVLRRLVLAEIRRLRRKLPLERQELAESRVRASRKLDSYLGAPSGGNVVYARKSKNSSKDSGDTESVAGE